MGPLSADRVIEGAGTAEPVWQRWLNSAGIPTRPITHLMPLNARLVVVAPHPDDEVLACGGLAAEHSASGGRTLVIAISDGEAGHAGSPHWNPHHLADERRAESAEGLRRLGAHDVELVRLGLPDGHVARHIGDLAGKLKIMLHSSDVVVSTWRLDGHPDHEATGLSVAQACLATGCRLLEAPVWMWHWASPGDARVPWHRLVGVALRGQPLDRKRNATDAHTSQLRARDSATGPVLGAAILARAERPTEYFST